MRCRIPSRDLSLKLNDTVCRYKKEPVWVKVIDSLLYLYKLNEVSTTGRYFATIKSTDPDLDVASVPLGYLQGEGQNRWRVYYLSRIPIRKVKQGLPVSAIRVMAVGEDENARSSKIHVGMVHSTTFSNMVKNEYPRLPDSMKALRGLYSKDPSQIYQIAVSRDIALEINQMGIINVHYKRNFVGWIQPDKSTVHVPKSDLSWVISQFLSSHLDWVVD